METPKTVVTCCYYLGRWCVWPSLSLSLYLSLLGRGPSRLARLDAAPLRNGWSPWIEELLMIMHIITNNACMFDYLIDCLLNYVLYIDFFLTFLHHSSGLVWSGLFHLFHPPPPAGSPSPCRFQASKSGIASGIPAGPPQRTHAAIPGRN